MANADLQMASLTSVSKERNVKSKVDVNFRATIGSALLDWGHTANVVKLPIMSTGSENMVYLKNP